MKKKGNYRGIEKQTKKKECMKLQSERQKVGSNAGKKGKRNEKKNHV